MIVRRAFLVAVGILAMVSAIPARADQIAVIGQGLLSCATWTQKRNTPMTPTREMERAGEEAWVVGFLSGAGVYAPGRNPIERTDINGVLTYIDKYCEAHPNEQMVRAGMAFVASH